LRVADFDNAISEYKVAWGGYSTIRATLSLFKKALIIKADYYFLLSGNDYPLLGSVDIEKQLQKGGEFIECWKLPAVHWGKDGGFERLQRCYFQAYPDWLNFKIVKCQRDFNIKKKLPSNMHFFGGHQWFTLSHNAISFLLRETPKYEHVYNYSLLADESIFQTILMNSHFSEHIVNDNLRLIEFVGTAWPKPRVWKESDFEYLVESGKVFARKFDSRDTRLFDMLDEFRTKYRE